MGRDVNEGRTLSTPLCKPPTNQEAWAQDLTQLCTVTTNIINMVCSLRILLPSKLKRSLQRSHILFSQQAYGSYPFTSLREILEKHLASSYWSELVSELPGVYTIFIWTSTRLILPRTKRNRADSTSRIYSLELGLTKRHYKVSGQYLDVHVRVMLT